MKNNIILQYHTTSKSYFRYCKYGTKCIFLKLLFFFILLHIVYDMFVSARKSPCAVPLTSDTFLKSELGYQCLILLIINHYGQFQNGRRKSHDFSWNVLLNIVFLNFACQTRFECLILHFNARSSFYKCWNVIFTTQSNMAARKCSKFHIFCKYMPEHMFFSVRKPPRSPLSQNHMISAWFVE